MVVNPAMSMNCLAILKFHDSAKRSRFKCFIERFKLAVCCPRCRACINPYLGIEVDDVLEISEQTEI